MTHMFGITGSTQPLEAVFRIAVLVIDPIDGGWTAQLLPDQGLPKLMWMNNFFHSGPIAEHLHLDVPYVPHLTVASATVAQQVKALSDELNADTIEVDAQFKTADVLRIGNGTVTREAKYELEG